MGAAGRVLGIALAIAALTGCGDSDGESERPAPVAGTFVGTLTGTDAYVAVVAGKENVVAYVCDGERGIGRLFAGRRSGGGFEARADGARIDVELARGGARGRVVLGGGRSGRFAARSARGEAGFYRKVLRRGGRELRLGWVVFADGSQRGALVQAGAISTAPTLRPASGTFTLAGRTQTAVRINAAEADASGLGLFGGLQG